MKMGSVRIASPEPDSCGVSPVCRGRNSGEPVTGSGVTDARVDLQLLLLKLVLREKCQIASELDQSDGRRCPESVGRAGQNHLKLTALKGPAADIHTYRVSRSPGLDGSGLFRSKKEPTQY